MANQHDTGAGKQRSFRGSLRKTGKAIMRSHKFKMPKGLDVPIKLRPWFLLFTMLIMILLAMLGFTDVTGSLPLNDKILHFICLGLATGVFYFIFDVDEDARRIWFWRHAGLLATGVLCFVFGGIASEFVQSLLPSKTFDFGDVLANLLGSSVGLWVSYNLERYYRHRREISRLYQPIDTGPEDSSSESGEDPPTYLPMYNVPQKGKATPMRESSRLGDVWDTREDVFSLGEEDEDEDVPQDKKSSSGATPKVVR